MRALQSLLHLLFCILPLKLIIFLTRVPLEVSFNAINLELQSFLGLLGIALFQVQLFRVIKFKLHIRNLQRSLFLLVVLGTLLGVFKLCLSLRFVHLKFFSFGVCGNGLVERSKHK